MYGRVGLLRGQSQRQTPIELTGGASGGRPSSGLLLVDAGSRFTFCSRSCRQTHRIPLGFVFKKPSIHSRTGGRMGCHRSWSYSIASDGGCGPSGKTPQMVRVCGPWHQRSQNHPCIADKYNSIPCASCHKEIRVPSFHRPIRYIMSGFCQGNGGRSGSKVLTVFHVRMYELPKKILGRRQSGSSYRGGRCRGCRSEALSRSTRGEQRGKRRATALGRSSRGCTGKLILNEIGRREVTTGSVTEAGAWSHCD